MVEIQLYKKYCLLHHNDRIKAAGCAYVRSRHSRIRQRLRRTTVDHNHCRACCHQSVSNLYWYNVDSLYDVLAYGDIWTTHF